MGKYTRRLSVAEHNQATSTPGTSSRIVGYPFISLEAAVSRAKQLWNIEQKNVTPDVVAVRHWGYAQSSSGGKQTISALRQFGLLAVVGEKETREVRLTERAIDILLEPNDSSIRAQALREAALSPKVYSDLLTKWPAASLPSDHTISVYLIREKHFNQKAVPDFLKNFRATVTFAELDTLPLSPESLSASDDGDLTHAAAQETQVSTEQTLDMRSHGTVGSIARATLGAEPGMRQDTWTLDSGTVLLRWPEKMSAADYEDFEGWVQLQLKKIKRSIPAQ